MISLCQSQKPRVSVARFILSVLISFLPALSQAAPALFFSDLDSGPNTGGLNNKGVFVTVWGTGFGSTAGTVTVGGGLVDNYPLWSDTKVVFQLGASAASGDIVVTTSSGAMSNRVPFTVRPGRIFFVSPTGAGTGNFASPMSPSAAYAGIQPGDTIYYRAGTYTGMYGGNWGNRNMALGRAQAGAAGNAVALVGYPLETATFVRPVQDSHTNIVLNDNGGAGDVADYVTIANLSFIGGNGCIGGGGIWTVAHGGASNIRIVGNVFTADYTGNTMSGLIEVQNNHWRIWGNEVKDAGTTPPINNNHGIYIQTGASDIDVGWNYLHNLRMGHVIQVHTDIQYLYEDVRIHDNEITATNIDDSRGINVGNVMTASYGAIYNNILHNLGQNFSAIAIYSGSWKIYNNTLYNIHAASPAMLWLSRQNSNTLPTAEVFNNIFYSDGVSPYIGVDQGALMSDITLRNNLYFNHGGGPAQDPAAVNADPLFVDLGARNFHLQIGSPAINQGSAAVNTVVTADHDGVGRPQGAAFDIGAYESTGSSLARPQNVRIIKK